MSDAVKSVIDAMRIARNAAQEAGLIFYVVSGARKEGDKWVVRITSAIGPYEAVIVSTSGEVTEWKSAKISSKS